MSRIIITNGIVFTGEEIIPRGTILVENEAVVEIFRGNSLESVARCSGDLVIDADGRLVTPGLINAHTHIYSALARGITLKETPPDNFIQILERLWWRLDAALSLRDIELSAHLHALDCLHHGVTTLFDHHASQRAVEGSLSTIAAALDQHGMRTCLCFEVSDRGGSGAAKAGIDENIRFINECSANPSPRLRAMFGLHASLTLSDETLRLCAEQLGDTRTGFHVHVGEDAADQEITRERYGQTVIERFAGAGILRKESICVHGVHLSDKELELLAASGAWLVHCPESNMNNAVGASTLSRCRDAGIRIALGTDGFTASMNRELLAAHLLQNHLQQHPGAGYGVVPELLYKANAALASEAFNLPLGVVRKNTPADLVVWEYRPPTPLHTGNFYGHVLFGLVAAQASDVLISGRHVLKSGRATTCDEKEISERCAVAAASLWERF